VERGLECDPEIQHYDMDEWMAKHGNVAPDHPAVFTGTHTHEVEVFPSAEAFLAKHGDTMVTALPEYATSGGALKHPFAAGKVTASFRQLTSFWNDSFVYFSDFKCYKDSLCSNVAEQFGKPELFLARTIRSRNFLVGGPDSGLPFHKHGMTWQGLAMGRKAWYILPPGSMSEELHDATGPYLFPVRAYHHLMQRRRLGARPLYCVQNPGEVLFVPQYWWHSTMNLDAYQVAYGEKPMKAIQPRSQELSAILSHFPAQAFDTGGFTASQGSGPTGRENPMPYTLMARQHHLRDSCNSSEVEGPAYGIAGALARMRGLAGSSLMQCGLAETAAFAHCMMGNWLGQLYGNCKSRLEPESRESMAKDVRERSLRWYADARELSPALFARESGICG